MLTTSSTIPKCAGFISARSSGCRLCGWHGLLTPPRRFAGTGYTACSEHAKARTGPILHRSMALSQRLEFRQSQALVMTPQLMQAIKLLQLSNLDLTAYVEGELEKNPLLERTSEEPGEPNQPNEAAGAGPSEGSGEAREGDWT